MGRGKKSGREEGEREKKGKKGCEERELTVIDAYSQSCKGRRRMDGLH
jgi:hypothetical protein